MFKYRAWKLLSMHKEPTQGTVEDFLSGFCSLYNGFKHKSVEFSKVKNHKFKCSITRIDETIRVVHDEVVHQLDTKGMVGEFFELHFNSGVSVINYLHMSFDDKKEPNELLDILVETIVMATEARRKAKDDAIRVEKRSTISYNDRRMLPLVFLAKEIIYLTLLTEGEDIEKLRNYNVGKPRTRTKTNESTK